MRFVAIMVCLACFLVGGMSGLLSAWFSGSVPAHVHTATVTVKPGDTVYTIAQRVDKHGWDVQAIVQWVDDRNRLVDGQVSAGQVIEIPVK